MQAVVELKPIDLINKSSIDLLEILSNEALRLGFKKDVIITKKSSSGYLKSYKLTGQFRLANNSGKRLELHALTECNKNWGISLFNYELFGFDGDFDYIPWILYNIEKIKGKNWKPFQCETKKSNFVKNLLKKTSSILK